MVFQLIGCWFDWLPVLIRLAWDFHSQDRRFDWSHHDPYSICHSLAICLLLLPSEYHSCRKVEIRSQHKWRMLQNDGIPGNNCPHPEVGIGEIDYRWPGRSWTNERRVSCRDSRHLVRTVKWNTLGWGWSRQRQQRMLGRECTRQLVLEEWPGINQDILENLFF